MRCDLHAHGASATTPARDKGPTVAAAAPQESKQNNNLDFHSIGLAEQATLTIAGEHCARSYLDRLQAAVAQPGELAAMLCCLRGELLHGACRLIEKALGGRRHG